MVAVACFSLLPMPAFPGGRSRRVPDDLGSPRPEVTAVIDYEFAMSLGVRHPDIDPMQITRALGLQPGHVWSKGEQRSDQAGVALPGNRRASYWYCEIAHRHEFPEERASLESEISRLLQTLRKSIGFMQGLNDGGGAAELFVTIFARGDFRIELLAEEAALLGRTGISLTIEVKPCPVAPRELAGSQ
jgi:hypothetical protein